MRKKFEHEELLNESRARLLYILMRDTSTWEEHLRIELRFFIALKYGTLRFAWFLLWRTLVSAWRTRQMFSRFPDAETPIDIKRIVHLMEHSPGLEFEEK